MTPVLEGRDFESIDDFVTEINRARLDRPRSWITYVGTVAGRSVQIKTYDCGYLQILRIDGQEQAAPMDMKPMAWKRFITEALTR